ncbi:hypothetical protein FDW83_04210 [Pseudarthrobacter sp. NamE2]|uniref:hypothetical protein n=1 Tax=Pseudarthrobacter sp. NamE2 TaxID=2576838 RepID=UPI0010FDD59A|nr:hypothetical protein [Pseudarthrobacter sp. NamE2]TLM85588.1 hypothetical protein FDW83_04210 [Pseudarthrobacter sp. NamE2]
MVQHRSELSMSRTGIHGGIRRGTAAAAIGAVLVLSTGVTASLADEGGADSGNPKVPVTLEARSSPQEASPRGNSGEARQNAPGQNKDQKKPVPEESVGANEPEEEAASRPILPVPSALLPAVRATLSPSASAVPTPAPAPASPSAAAPTGSAPAAAPAGSAPAAAPAPTKPAPAPVPSRTLAGASPAGAAPAAPTTTPPAAAVTAPAEAAAATASAPAAAAVPGPDPSTPAGLLPPAEEAISVPGERVTPSTGAGAKGSQAEASPLYSHPQTRAGWTPYTSEGTSRSSAVLNNQPDERSAMVWLGSGLVGVAGAAGVVFFRLRNP